jgi:5-methylcytosine-specific restriction endonuclease McrA
MNPANRWVDIQRECGIISMTLKAMTPSIPGSSKQTRAASVLSSSSASSGRAARNPYGFPSGTPEYYRAYYAAHLDVRRATNRICNQKHSEARRKQSNQYYVRNKERIHEKQRNHRLRNAERRRTDRSFREQTRALWRRKYAALSAYARREKNTVANVRKRAAGGISRGFRERQRLIQHDRCWWCNRKLGGCQTHIDHRIPVCKGGTSNESNLVLACSRCNYRKQDRLPWQFMPGRLL